MSTLKCNHISKLDDIELRRQHVIWDWAYRFVSWVVGFTRKNKDRVIVLIKFDGFCVFLRRHSCDNIIIYGYMHFL